MSLNKSKAIKEGLGDAKKRGVKLGNPRLDEIRCTDPTNANRERSNRADQFAEDMREIVLELVMEGVSAPSKVAQELNERGIQARRGGKWTTTQVQRVVQRIEKMNGPGEIENFQEMEDRI